jgi:hypothetical protein
VRAGARRFLVAQAAGNERVCVESGSCEYLDPEIQDLFALYAKLTPQERRKFFASGESLVG